MLWKKMKISANVSGYKFYIIIWIQRRNKTGPFLLQTKQILSIQIKEPFYERCNCQDFTVQINGT